MQTTRLSGADGRPMIVSGGASSDDKGAYLAEARRGALTLGGSLDYLVQLQNARAGGSDAALSATFDGLRQQARRVADLLGECV